MTRVSATVLRVAATRRQRTYLVSDFPGGHVATECNNASGNLQPKNRRHSRRQRISSFPLQQIRAIDSGEIDLDENFMRTDRGKASQRNAHGLRATPLPV